MNRQNIERESVRENDVPKDRIKREKVQKRKRIKTKEKRKRKRKRESNNRKRDSVREEVM